MKNQKGFTLIEMLIVLTIISVLLILIVPNLADKNETVQTKGCEALVQMAETQIQSYNMDHPGENLTSLQTLLDEKYLKSDTCAGGTKKVSLANDGSVTLTPLP